MADHVIEFFNGEAQIKRSFEFIYVADYQICCAHEKKNFIRNTLKTVTIVLKYVLNMTKKELIWMS